MRNRGEQTSRPRFLPRGRHPPFNTAPVADSQRSSDPLFKTSVRADSQRWRPHRALLELRGHGIMNIETPQPAFQPGMAERAIDTAADVSRTITEISTG